MSEGKHDIIIRKTRSDSRVSAEQSLHVNVSVKMM